MKEFTVRHISAQELNDTNAYVLGLSEDARGFGQCLLIQKTLAPDPQDVRLGMDTYCLSDELGRTHYGGVTGCAVEGDILTILLDPAAAEDLGIEEGYRLVLDVAPHALARLRGGLQRLGLNFAPGLRPHRSAPDPGR